MENKTYYIITIGCQMNKSDSERVAGYLEEHGYKNTGERSRAGLVVVNTCGVRQSAEDRVYGLVNKIKKENPEAKLVITGCLAEREDMRAKLGRAADAWMPIGKFSIFNFPRPRDKQFSNNFPISQFPNFLTDAMSDCQNYLSTKPKYDSNISAFVPIGNGCNNFCTYCVVPYARGREVWRPAKDILEEARDLVNRGYKEITLIAQNVNSYKYNANPRIYANAANTNYANDNKNINFCSLLRMINEIEGDFWIRFATSHPKDMSDELIKTVAECDKICEHIHLPAQAGDDEVLRAMNRGYTVGQYAELIGKIRRAMPEASITTDVIVGFPGETEDRFNNTVKLFEEVKFDMAYTAEYSPRPGTAAAKLSDDVPRAEKKRREHILTEVLRRTALENNREYAGKIVEVLVEGRNRKGEWMGRTRAFKNVELRIINSELRAGMFTRVKITEAKDFGLAGEIVK